MPKTMWVAMLLALGFSVMTQAQEFPASGRRVPEAPSLDVRELLEFPYRIIYRADGETIQVLAIVHGRQDLPSHLPR